eukprot:m.54106 g.54106  ORF g.54106 m.54106 type:complete len:400 (+) comp21867_c0_seq1:179-1378(+)
MVQLAINGEWYDLEKWAKKHPGGAAILSHYQDEDATEVFYSLHSEKAIQQLKHMKPIDRKEAPPTACKLDVEFRALADKLKAEGWWERSFVEDMKLLLPIVAMIVWGTLYSYTYPLTSMFVIGIAMEQAGWLGHDSVHARNDRYCEFLATWLPGFVNGQDKIWWSRKHNTHHVMTNHVGVDPDIDLMPALFLMAPTKALDHHFRKYQHLYAAPLYMFLFALWRYNSLNRAYQAGDYYTLATKQLPGYIWLACLPTIVSLGAILISGFLVAWVVVQSHEDEDMNLSTRPTGFVKTQMDSTCDIICPDPISEYLFGGMQYQLSHHLFPTMPRYKYPALRVVMSEWAAERGLEYKQEGIVKMAKKHFSMLKRNAEAECAKHCVPGGWSEHATNDKYVLGLAQ